MPRHTLILLSFLVAAAPSWAEERLRVEAVRVWTAPDNTRVVFDTNRPARHRLFILADPPRVVLDLRDAHPVEPRVSVSPGDRYLRGLRTGIRNGTDLRVVLDLKQRPRVEVFQLQPHKHYGHRLVVDLLPREVKLLPPVPEAIAEELRDVIVAIDAGHGGEDPGALGRYGTLEKDVVLQIASKLAARIDAHPGMRAVNLREGDYFMALPSRRARARALRADLFVSIHADAFHDSRVRGSSVYVLSEKGASSEAAKQLADRENVADLIGGVSLKDKSPSLRSILLDLSQTGSLESSINAASRVLQGLRKVGKAHHDKVQSADFLVLKSPDIPSILIETGFISNPEEEKKLSNRQHQDRLVSAIVDGLSDYFGEFAPPDTLFAQRVQHQHVIRKGDTLSELAEYYNVSAERLRRHNGMQGDLLRVGQVLVIPRPNTGT